MTIYNLYIFNSAGSCIYYHEWLRRREAGMSRDEEMKLMYGLIFSLKSFVQKLSPVDCKDGFLNYRTSRYKLNFYETGTGLKLIMNTDVNSTNVREYLQKIYKEVYVEYVVKNPECKLNKEIVSEVFKSKLDKLVRSLPIFNNRVI
uniref:Trafficking protein particle complex subunit n=1 Tax=Parasteatoda tepidariorum TaxID=114398 RepID=A0A2L2YBC8_PARTP|nr:trafficking protein particle complex subunit 1 [Parasteatoda tepidariorum]XP_015912823.1 trafficking protein particle complex subunit 1 [Parasteatoda tepidariorum]XP_015912824.1 trafficking protein particle complex subunit 1 [Parasteatoda tepidariorum]